MSDKKKTKKRTTKKDNPNQPWIINGRDLVADVINLMCPQEFDAKEYFAILKKMNAGMSKDNRDNTLEILVWMQWTLADNNTRSPQTEGELAQILNKSVQTFRYQWQKKGDIKKAMKNIIDERLFGPDGYALFSISLLIKVVKGDPKAMQIFLDQNNRRDEETSEKDENRSKKLDNVLKLAQEIAGDKGKNNHYVQRFTRSSVMREAK